jgi:N-acetyl-anhydromuramyl-L-alanine amidase AmpD
VSYETVLWPYIEARWNGGRRSKPVSLIVIHDEEYPEKPSASEDIARDFANRPANDKASTHICVDCDSIIQCVNDSLIAWAAPPVNDRAIHIELAGFGAQKTADWRDNYSNAMLGLAADAAAQYALKFNLPILHLTDDQLRDGKPGFVGHDQVSRVFKQSTHTDPGFNFPWMRFMMWTRGSYEERRMELGR